MRSLPPGNTRYIHSAGGRTTGDASKAENTLRPTKGAASYIEVSKRWCMMRQYDQEHYD